ncbi:hypothetical protein LWE61_01325 [Sphingobium sufflavum]|uniref:hypothetical protein n=1 Tax=Sphingobium sufflavum TaxID=1129547 RepID=UPI001F2DC346|nr:hypothetical protein [Sphingobium sufflavum]MCE7795190.1 hypothetical protein [Sphingobium sufflavum]
MKKASVLAVILRLLYSIIVAIFVMIVGAILSAALVYCYEAAPIFLWLFFVACAGVAFVSLSTPLMWLEGDRRLPILILLFWVIIFGYVDMMRYLAEAWHIEMGKEAKSLLAFPRYFTLHTQYFFRDLWAIVSGNPAVPPVEIVPPPPPTIPKNSGPLFAINQWVSDASTSIALNLLSSLLFALWWERKK